MKQHLDACSGSRTRRNRKEAVRRKKAKEAEAEREKATEGCDSTTGTSNESLGHLPQREFTEMLESRLAPQRTHLAN